MGRGLVAHGFDGDARLGCSRLGLIDGARLGCSRL